MTYQSPKKTRLVRRLLTTFTLGLVIAGGSFAAVAALGGVSWPDQLGERGPTIVRDMQWAGAPNLDVGAGAQVTFVQGPVASMVITGPKSLVDYIKVEGGKVTLNKPKGSFFGIPFEFGSQQGVKIAVTAPDVGDFNIHSGASLEIAGLKRAQASVKGNSGASIEGRVDVDRLTVEAHSGGSVDLAGRAGDLEVSANSGGSADLGDLASVNAKAHANSGGSVDLAATGAVDADANSGGSIDLKGRPATLTTSVNSGGSVDVSDAPATNTKG